MNLWEIIFVFQKSIARSGGLVKEPNMYVGVTFSLPRSFDLYDLRVHGIRRVVKLAVRTRRVVPFVDVTQTWVERRLVTRHDVQLLRRSFHLLTISQRHPLVAAGLRAHIACHT